MAAAQHSALVLLADGTEEIEFTTSYEYVLLLVGATPIWQYEPRLIWSSQSILIRAGWNVKSVGVKLANPFFAQCSRNVRILPDFPSPHEIPDRFLDAASVLVIPGGAPGAKTFCKSDDVLRLIREFRNDGKYVALICAGTTALVESIKAPEAEGEATKKCKVTSHPSVKQEIVDAGWTYADDKERVVVDGKVITSRGPGTAILFALTIVEMLAGKEKAEELRGPMICAETI
ncbi:hypothetical protein BT93_L5693 [Corymbia citriodora subsp. variegata]|uniref:DJ-1/PfpI domain-containing protein n=1 Tax=Corymbia citriodora subsp. variegata TaxID=360336 RepID=A0A8T0CJ48_CORYI|nr:hypothetical protein BT93_L5693 [Corymbia citriodora subsp. variegata]